ncbi:hypothetical protein QBC38DRAFT_458053 [Podospora fimiseda]|uniref:CBM1 domain-containing protein n=1 Tax=Podospora fimiseda TaxID=252190 RepID=A0AAN7BK13_9PEZI|nr:hypothetical protein QBC38DRAFT_458053 [Podospora fimiseda]
MKASILLGSVLSGVAMAQFWPPIRPSSAAPPAPTQSLWGRCGGQNWDGPTRCPAGSYCRFDGNIYYEQCVPNDLPGSANPNPSPPGPIKTTLSTVPVVTTRVTVLPGRPTTTTARVVTVTLVPDDPCDHQVWC